MKSLKISFTDNSTRNYIDLYLSAKRSEPRKYNKVMFWLTGRNFLSILLFVTVFCFGYYFDPEKAKVFALWLAVGATGIYALISQFYEGKMFGHDVGLIPLNNYGFSRGTGNLTVALFSVFFIFYTGSIFCGFTRGEIWGLWCVIALLLATVSWKAHYFYLPFKGNEEDARRDLDDFSFGKEDEDRFIEEMRNRGLIQ